MKTPYAHLAVVVLASSSVLPCLGHLHPPSSTPETQTQIILQPQMSSDAHRHTSADDHKPAQENDQNLPNLTGALTLLPRISLFYDYVRDVGPVNQRTMDPDQQTTILAPINAAIMRLDRKPHQGLQSSRSDTPFQDLSESAQIAREESSLAYLARWVSNHVVTQTIRPDQLPSSAESSPFEFKNMNDQSFKIVCNQAERGEQSWQGCKIEPGNIQIVGCTSAANGVVYTIDNIIPLDTDQASGDVDD